MASTFKRLLFLVITIVWICDQSDRIFAAPSIPVTHDNDNANQNVSWWHSAVVYQIYIRSFYDTTGDGVGDLNGVIARLPYLASLSVGIVWLTPFYKSPNADFGYDVSNFVDIDCQYGSFADFDRLIGTATRLGIRIVLDFVPNHTSDQHEWFRRSENRDAYYADFYVWHAGYAADDNGTSTTTTDPLNGEPPMRRPPSNWVSSVGGSAWEYSKRRGEFYLHQFNVKQPDLNYRNPNVVSTMVDVLRFWLERGVSGFRMDAVSFLVEAPRDEAGHYPDERSGHEGEWTLNQDETYAMIYEWRRVAKEFEMSNPAGEEILLIGEIWAPVGEKVNLFYGNGTHEGAQIPLNFELSNRISKQATSKDYKRMLEIWLDHLPAGRIANWFIGNHDRERIASRMGDERIDSMNMLMLTMGGVTFTYAGEEIGMRNGNVSWYDDRDHQRTPFQWDSTTSGGFSTNSHTWLPMADNYVTVNVAVQLEAERSHLKTYTQLVELRKEPTMQHGEVLIRTPNERVLVILRRLAGHDTFVTVANIGNRTEEIDLRPLARKLPLTMKYAAVDAKSEHDIGETVMASNVQLQPFESFVLRCIVTQNMIATERSTPVVHIL